MARRCCLAPDAVEIAVDSAPGEYRQGGAERHRLRSIANHPSRERAWIGSVKRTARHKSAKYFIVNLIWESIQPAAPVVLVVSAQVCIMATIERLIRNVILLIAMERAKMAGNRCS